jgi:hypothetical protein
VAYPTTHNAMSNRQEHWLVPNQNYSISQQLNDGIRGLMLDVHPLWGKPYLMHSTPLLGAKKLVEGLVEIRQFLETHPWEVVTLIFETNVHAAQMAETFEQAQLGPYLYAHAKGQPFPTLREMVLSNRRLVVFTDFEGGQFPWYHAVWEYCVETPWKAKKPSDLDSRRNRGQPQNELVILNHFLTHPTSSPRLAKQVNQNPFFLTRVERFVQETRRFPNFITVDYYDLGELFEVVDTINGLPWTQRRHSAPRHEVLQNNTAPDGTPLRAEDLLTPELTPSTQ